MGILTKNYLQMKTQTATQKPFWDDLRNPITMHKINPSEKYLANKSEYNRQYNKKLTSVS